MSRIQIRLLTIALCALALLGCNSPKTPANLNSGSLPEWQAHTENPLIHYIPQDAPFVIATQREQTADNKGVQALMQLMSAYLSKADFGLQFQLGKSNDSESQMHRYCLIQTDQDRSPEAQTHICDGRTYDDYDNKIDTNKDESGLLYDLLNDYAGHATEYGLDPHGQLDIAGYIKDAMFVLHITVTDEFKAMDGLDKIVQETQHKFRAKSFVFETNDSQGKDRIWKKYQIKNTKNDHAIALAAHAINGVLSLVIYDPHTPLPDTILSAQPNHYLPNTAIRNSFLTGHIEYANLAKTLFSNPIAIEITDRYYIDTTEQFYEVSKLCDEHFEYCNYDTLLYYLKEYTDPHGSDPIYGNFDDEDDEDDEEFDELDCSHINLSNYSENISTSTEDETTAIRNRQKLETCEQISLRRDQKKAEKQRKWDEHRAQMLEKIETAMAHGLIVGTERLRKLGLTSIGDAACMQEIELLTKDMPSLDWSFAYNNDGEPNINVRFNVAQDELYQKMQAMLTDYLSLQDSYKQDNFMPWLHLSLGIDMGKALELLNNYLNTQTKREWACFQVNTYVERLAALKRSLKKGSFSELNGMTSFTGVIRELPKNGFGSAKFWLNLRASTKLMNDLTKSFFRKTATDTVITAGSDPEVQMVLVNKQDLLLGTQPFDITQIDLTDRKKDHLIEFYSRKLDMQDYLKGSKAKLGKAFAFDRSENIQFYMDVEAHSLSLTYKAGKE
ncbi:MAG: hypothetical protein IJ165_12300 [Proteobacteria bacterium]|nr:hypothetical protein [Pseudomonadota bacterium]